MPKRNQNEQEKKIVFDRYTVTISGKLLFTFGYQISPRLKENVEDSAFVVK